MIRPAGRRDRPPGSCSRLGRSAPLRRSRVVERVAAGDRGVGGHQYDGVPPDRRASLAAHQNEDAADEERGVAGGDGCGDGAGPDVIAVVQAARVPMKWLIVVGESRGVIARSVPMPPCPGAGVRGGAMGRRPWRPPSFVSADGLAICEVPDDSRTPLRHVEVGRIVRVPRRSGGLSDLCRRVSRRLSGGVVWERVSPVNV